VEFLGEAFSTDDADLVVVGADEEQAFALGGVGVERDDGDAVRDSLVDAGPEEGGVGDGDEDAGGVALDGVVDGVAFRFAS